MSEIRVFHSHIEVYPYKEGDCPEIEKMYSKWEKNGRDRFYLVPVAYYILNDILYLPRGTNTNLLEKYFNTVPMLEKDYDPYARIKAGVGKLKAKSKMQEEAMKFLTASDEFAYSGRFSQLGVNLATGDGKTYAAIYAVLKLKIRAMIIVHKTDLVSQWEKSIYENTTLPEDRVCVMTAATIDEVLRGKHTPYDIYIVTHQLLNTYARDHTWIMVRELFKKLKIGIRIVDEAHKFFHNTLMTDYFSNCYKSFYLTATFGRSETSGETVIYNRAFSSMVRFGEQTLGYEERRKHINFVPVYFRSTPYNGMMPRVEISRGFSNYLYIDYELKKSGTLMRVLRRLLDETAHLDGKTLIISPKVESVQYIAEFVKENYGDCGVLYGKVGKADREQEMAKKYISSTSKLLGEGNDIKGLRCVICLEQIGSKIIADQIAGRLREYAPDKETYMFYPVDLLIPKCGIFLKSILPTMKKKCKEIIINKMLDL